MVPSAGATPEAHIFICHLQTSIQKLKSIWSTVFAASFAQVQTYLRRLLCVWHIWEGVWVTPAGAAGASRGSAEHGHELALFAAVSGKCYL